LGGFAISVFLNYFLVLILGLFNAVTYSALLIFYGILLLGLTIKTKLDFKIKINVYCLVILLLILFPIAYYQITQTKYLLIDTLPYVGSVQQVSSFNDYNAFSNNPSPLYSDHQVLPIISTYFGTLSIFSGLKAIYAISGFLIIQNILLILSFYLLSETLFGKKSGKWSLLFLIMSFVWARTLDVRGTTISFIFLSGALAFLKRNKIMTSIFLSLCLMTNPAIGLIVYLIVTLYGLFNLLLGEHKETVGSVRSIIISILFSSVYLYSNVKELVSPLIFLIGLILLIILYFLTYIKFKFTPSKKYLKPIIFFIYFTTVGIYLTKNKIIMQYPSLFLLSVIGFLMFLKFNKKNLLLAVSCFLAPVLIIKYSYLISHILPFFQTGNFVTKAENYCLTYFAALFASYTLIYLIKELKMSKQKLITIFYIILIIVFLTIPRNLNNYEKEFQENSIVNNYKYWMSGPHHLAIPLPEDKSVIEKIDNLIQNNTITMDTRILNHDPGLDISAFTGVNEILVINTTQRYSNTLTTNFRMWAGKNDFGTGVYYDPEELSEHDYTLEELFS